MKVLVSGSSGLIGRALLAHLAAQGHEVHALVRRPAAREREVTWDPARRLLRASELEGFEGFVHLAGESIAEGRWSAEKLRRIEESRVAGTRFLCETLGACAKKPRVLVCASAIGFYGDRSDELLAEDAAAGAGFLARVCQGWEEACQPARAAGVRVVNLRIGVVLSRHGGALAKMLLPFRLGLGGKIGSGRQWMSWIELGDVLGALGHALVTDSLVGPVNAVSPTPVTNAEFTKTLGRVLSRPTFFAMPAPAARLAFGKMADELLLASTRVEPAALRASGFPFAHPELEEALRHALDTR